MSFTIYKHTLKDGFEHSGWGYVGQTAQKLYKRFQNGNGYTFDHDYAFARALQKYGWDNFETTILESNIQTQAEANEREIYWIAFFHTYVHDPQCRGYNLTKGGNSYCAKQVICLETGVIYNSIAEAAELTHVSCGQISRQLNNHINKQANKRTIRKLHWASYQEGLDIEKELQKYYVVKCLETNEYFVSLTEAAKKFNTSNNQITHCCNNPNKFKTAGGVHWISLK